MAKKKTKRSARNKNIVSRKEAEDYGYQRGMEAAEYFEPDKKSRFGAMDEIHELQMQAGEAEENSRQYAPFEQFAASINRIEDDDTADILWAHYEAGVERGIREGIKKRFGASKNPASRGKKKDTRKRNTHDASKSQRAFDAALDRAEGDLASAMDAGSNGLFEPSLNRLIETAYWIGRASAEMSYARPTPAQKNRVLELEKYATTTWGSDFMKWYKEWSGS